MHRTARHPFYHRLAAVLLLAHLLAVLLLAASPRLHQWVHPDAGGDDHDCAAVLFIHGGNGTAPEPPMLPGFVGAPVEIFVVPWPTAGFVPSVFAAGSVFEHAPPVVG